MHVFHKNTSPFVFSFYTAGYSSGASKSWGRQAHLLPSSRAIALPMPRLHTARLSIRFDSCCSKDPHPCTPHTPVCRSYLAPVTSTRDISGPTDLVARLATAVLRSLGVMPVKAEPVNASADEAASTASAAYLRALAMLMVVFLPFCVPFTRSKRATQRRGHYI